MAQGITPTILPPTSASWSDAGADTLPRIHDLSLSATTPGSEPLDSPTIEELLSDPDRLFKFEYICTADSELCGPSVGWKLASFTRTQSSISFAIKFGDLSGELVTLDVDAMRLLLETSHRITQAV